jgi:4,5-DOPA dioxygenase extradiol
MERRHFLQLLAGGTFMAGTAFGLKELNAFNDNKKTDQKLPVLFLGHGSPMNAIADNNFTKALNNLGKKVPKPQAILCVSAHWMTEGSWLTHMEKPKTIHDFYGFPEALFKVQYPAPGRPDIAKSIKETITDHRLNLDHEAWGLDHGTWSVLKHMYPDADIPVMQLSIYMQRPPEYHFKLGQELAKLREKGVLIVGSGNIVHNLRRISWEEKARPLEWAQEFDQWVAQKIIMRDFSPLQKEFLNSEAGKLSNPSLDHYYPLLYILGASDVKDTMKFEYEEIQNASISMRCVSFGMPA